MMRTAQIIQPYSKPDITAGTYIHGVPEENLKAQGEFAHLDAGGGFISNKGEFPDGRKACFRFGAVGAAGWASG